MKLSIVILNYNTRDHLKRCLKSLEASRQALKLEVIVVDNASTDQSVAMVRRYFPWVRVIAHTHNLGFAGGNNVGLRKVHGRFVLLLNSDTNVYRGTLAAMVAFMERNPTVGVATCRVELANGELDWACHRGFPTPWNALCYFSGLEKLFPKSRLFGGYHQGWKDLQAVHEIDCPVGAFFLTRNKILKTVGLLDERFFLYAEDIDWALRIKNAGWQIMYVPTVKILHYKKTSGRAKKEQGKVTKDAKTVRRAASSYFFETMRVFYDKHYKKQYPWIVRWVVLSGIWLISRIRK